MAGLMDDDDKQCLLEAQLEGDAELQQRIRDSAAAPGPTKTAGEVIAWLNRMSGLLKNS